jgi:hypothetical protein
MGCAGGKSHFGIAKSLFVHNIDIKPFGFMAFVEALCA